MKFHGRKREIQVLKRLFDSDGLQTAVVYGRRRVGKSELIKKVMKDQNIRCLYYECKQTTEMNNVESLAAVTAESYGFPNISFNGIEELLRFIFRQSFNEPIILVLDEYPYLRASVKGLDSILQSLIDEFRESARLKFILCGSYIDVMKSLLDSANPLYGRIDRTICLKAMDYKESSEFYPEFSNRDKVRLYSVFGGIPYYNRLIDSSLSVRENITELIASPGARLENEVSMYLKSEISKITNANEVIEALAKGYSRFSDILSQSHVSSSPTLSDVLDKLMRMEIVEKISPVNDENNISGESELYHAFGVAKPIAKEATDIDPRGGYTANWEPTPKATSYLVTNYKADKIEDDNENYEVFRDDFENIESEPRQMLR